MFDSDEEASSKHKAVSEAYHSRRAQVAAVEMNKKSCDKDNQSISDMSSSMEDAHEPPRDEINQVTDDRMDDSVQDAKDELN